MMRILMVLVVSWVLVACSQPAVNPLNNTSWQLVSINGEKLEPTETPVLRFGNGTLDGQGFCNSYSADYQVNGDALSIAPVVATEKACEDTIFNILEHNYFTALNTTARYVVNGDELQFLDVNNAVIVLLRKAP